LTSGVTLERFEQNGATLVDELSGVSSADHILFLHGWGGNRESLRGVAALFQHTHRIHLLDLPGFGDAPPPPESWGTVEYADLVQQYLFERVSGQALLVGHSFGGRVSIRLASRHLPQIRDLVLMGVPGLPQPAFSRARIRRWSVRTLRRVLIGLQPVVGSGPVKWHSERFGSKDYQAAGVLRPVLVRTVNEDLTESARLIACPTLLIWGCEDSEAPPWLAERYAGLIGGTARGGAGAAGRGEAVTVRMLPHKDHFPFNGTGAHLCADIIRHWLAGRQNG
jgi:pimeloyl-ACP methyl ester carboxylesterase